MPRASTPGDSVGGAHPLQSVLDAMGRDPALADERRRIEAFIARSTVVMSDAEPDREDLAQAKQALLREQARDEVNRHLDQVLVERDKDWIRLATAMLDILTARPAEMNQEVRDRLVHALLIGSYARLAPDAYMDDLASGRLSG